MSGLPWVAIAAVGWLAAIVLAIVAALHGRRATTLALQIRTRVEPFLRRRATELEGDAPAASDPVAGPEAIVETVCALADKLVERERKQVELGDTLNVAASDTMPLTPTPAPAPKR